MQITQSKLIIGIASLIVLTGCAVLVPSPPDLGGYVLAVNGNEILIDLTEQNGITKGMTFLILRRTAANQPMQVLGEMVVTQLEPKLSRGRLLVENEQIRLFLINLTLARTPLSGKVTGKASDFCESMTNRILSSSSLGSLMRSKVLN